MAPEGDYKRKEKSEMSIETFSAPMIATAVYIIIELFKRFAHHDERYKRWYPIVAGVLGMAMGAMAYITGAVEIPAENLATAIFIGLCSGLCATGTDQLIARLLKEKATVAEDETTMIEEGAQNDGKEG